MIWYFAHPYSAKYLNGLENMGRQEELVNLCIERTNELIDWGFLIYSPIVMTHWLHKAKQRPYEEWIEFNKEMMEKMDGLILAPNWENSKGCVNEKKWFEEHNKPIKLYEDIYQKKKK